MNRRDFMKIVGIRTATSTGALMDVVQKVGSSEGRKGEVPTDKMTYRTFSWLPVTMFQSWDMVVCVGLNLFPTVMVK